MLARGESAKGLGERCKRAGIARIDLMPILAALVREGTSLGSG
jgi:hypothetical protein